MKFENRQVGFLTVLTKNFMVAPPKVKLSEALIGSNFLAGQFGCTELV